jgi:hypothetical protein
VQFNRHIYYLPSKNKLFKLVKLVGKRNVIEGPRTVQFRLSEFSCLVFSANAVVVMFSLNM